MLCPWTPSMGLSFKRYCFTRSLVSTPPPWKAWIRRWKIYSFTFFFPNEVNIFARSQNVLLKVYNLVLCDKSYDHSWDVTDFPAIICYVVLLKLKYTIDHKNCQADGEWQPLAAHVSDLTAFIEITSGLSEKKIWEPFRKITLRQLQ